MVFGRWIGDGESHRDTVEELSFPEVVADEKNELVISGSHFGTGEQGRIDAAVIVSLDGLEFSRGIGRPKFDRHSASGNTPGDIEHMCG